MQARAAPAARYVVAFRPFALQLTPAATSSCVHRGDADADDPRSVRRPVPVFVTIRYPRASRPSSVASCAVKVEQAPQYLLALGTRGITHGGNMSNRDHEDVRGGLGIDVRIAKASAERLSGVTGISPAAILQKRQSAIGPSKSCGVDHCGRDDRGGLEPERVRAQPGRMIPGRDGRLTLGPAASPPSGPTNHDHGIAANSGRRGPCRSHPPATSLPVALATETARASLALRSPSPTARRSA